MWECRKGNNPNSRNCEHCAKEGKQVELRGARTNKKQTERGTRHLNLVEEALEIEEETGVQIDGPLAVLKLGKEAALLQLVSENHISKSNADELLESANAFKNTREAAGGEAECKSGALQDAVDAVPNVESSSSPVVVQARLQLSGKAGAEKQEPTENFSIEAELCEVVLVTPSYALVPVAGRTSAVGYGHVSLDSETGSLACHVAKGRPCSDFAKKEAKGAKYCGHTSTVLWALRKCPDAAPQRVRFFAVGASSFDSTIASASLGASPSLAQLPKPSSQQSTNQWDDLERSKRLQILHPFLTMKFPRELPRPLLSYLESRHVCLDICPSPCPFTWPALFASELDTSREPRLRVCLPNPWVKVPVFDGNNCHRIDIKDRPRVDTSAPRVVDISRSWLHVELSGLSPLILGRRIKLLDSERVKHSGWNRAVAKLKQLHKLAYGVAGDGKKDDFVKRFESLRLHAEGAEAEDSSACTKFFSAFNASTAGVSKGLCTCGLCNFFTVNLEAEIPQMKPIFTFSLLLQNPKDMVLDQKWAPKALVYDHVCQALLGARKDHPIAFPTAGRVPTSGKDPDRFAHLADVSPDFQSTASRSVSKPTGEPPSGTRLETLAEGFAPESIPRKAAAMLSGATEDKMTSATMEFVAETLDEILRGAVSANNLETFTPAHSRRPILTCGPILEDGTLRPHSYSGSKHETIGVVTALHLSNHSQAC
ncbi:hypothetical protein KFL_012290020 [Klebsormidium nitens]|uniref:Uncharacterized protein n=1 Tax=Klebsormidium nitens TaxID=105231 RepID=A0A1Y1IQ28_KLENI|nr:hypothetical protein KFL_012290020 [Klebsormidium nitens]|eukprot:GAQ92970.1 hypothetical protein KFL_012290020 [Klebsormidium nitens]